MSFASLGESGPCIANIFTLITILLVCIFLKTMGWFLSTVLEGSVSVLLICIVLMDIVVKNAAFLYESGEALKLEGWRVSFAAEHW